MVDEIMRGLVNTPMENLDNFITSEVTKHLFEERGHPFSGLDLVSLNIQRGTPSVAQCSVQLVWISRTVERLFTSTFLIDIAIPLIVVVFLRLHAQKVQLSHAWRS